MAKKLRQVTISNPSVDYVKAPLEKEFAAKHSVLKTGAASYVAPQFNKEDPEGEDAHFQATNVKVSPRPGKSATPESSPKDGKGPNTTFDNVSKDRKFVVPEETVEEGEHKYPRDGAKGIKKLARGVPPKGVKAGAKDPMKHLKKEDVEEAHSFDKSADVKPKKLTTGQTPKHSYGNSKDAMKKFGSDGQTQIEHPNNKQGNHCYGNPKMPTPHSGSDGQTKITEPSEETINEVSKEKLGRYVMKAREDIREKSMKKGGDKRKLGQRIGYAAAAKSKSED